MGEAADDAFDAAFRRNATEEAMLRFGCRRCPQYPHDHISGDDECPVCKDFGWIDANGDPCEP